jgi:hypothetical protein
LIEYLKLAAIETDFSQRSKATKPDCRRNLSRNAGKVSAQPS